MEKLSVMKTDLRAQTGIRDIPVQSNSVATTFGNGYLPRYIPWVRL